jgi:hypothetical protein
VYSTSIQLLLSRGLVEESLSVLFEVVWANAGLPAHTPLDLGTYELVMRKLQELKYDASYIGIVYRLFSSAFMPNTSMYASPQPASRYSAPSSWAGKVRKAP